MVFDIDTDDPIQREAVDAAARAAEWLLDRHNASWAQELALDVLATFVDGFDSILYSTTTIPELNDPKKRLAWALVLTERRTDLRPHEQRLLGDAWLKVRELQLQREWEEMGL